MLESRFVAIRIPGNKDNIFVPKDPSSWTKDMESTQDEGDLYIAASSTDLPAVLAVGFFSNTLGEESVQNQLSDGQAFGFYLTASFARELEAFFRLLAVALETEKG